MEHGVVAGVLESLADDRVLEQAARWWWVVISPAARIPTR